MNETILALMNENPINLVKLHDVIAKMNTVDIAEIFEELDKEKTIQIFRLLPKSMAADVFSYIVPEKQQIIVGALTDNEIGKIINELFVDDAVDFIEEMPANVVERVLKNIYDDKRQLINQLLQYPEDSAGSIMTTEYIALREDASVREAFDTIRATGINKETIYTCFVIRRDRLLVGVISAKALLLARPQDRIGDIMDANLILAHTTDDQELIADLFKKYSLLSLPVVDKEQRLVGIVTVDDVVKVIEEENTEDFERMAALNPSYEPYLKTKIFKLAGNRIVWLMVLMLSATFTGSIISHFEDSIAVLPALIAFIPMLMGTGGNAGSQSSTLIIRGMALGEIQIRDILKVIWREVRVGAICGLALGLVNFARIYLMNGKDAVMSLTVTLSLFCTIILAKSAGCILPIVAKKLRIDPAILAAPLISTIIDGTSLIVYFSIARVILHV
ncbi:MAG: magnesium transporter [Peptococcaceae bacterium]|jgi:magnesium transporter|nr:magnesium transporter [Peptococcaceae bacterium]